LLRKKLSRSILFSHYRWPIGTTNRIYSIFGAHSCKGDLY